MWQRPLDSFYPDDGSWYYKASLGRNTLATMMSKISRQGQLSQQYTNHSIRSTAITVLDEVGAFVFFMPEKQTFSIKFFAYILLNYFHI